MPKEGNAVDLVKRAAVEAVEAEKPVRLLFGTVVGESPLKIQAEQGAVYEGKMLVLTQRVTAYETEALVNGQTVRAAVRAALRTGERVLLARVQKGKRFVVLDRLGGE